MADLGMLHLIPEMKKLRGVLGDPWGHIGEGISWLRIFSQSGRNLALLPLTRAVSGLYHPHPGEWAICQTLDLDGCGQFAKPWILMFLE